jgi:hypothetical protein
MSELDPSQLLAEWRSAERRLSARDPDASDYEDMISEAERLRSEYQATHRDDAPLSKRHRRMNAEPEGSLFG